MQRRTILLAALLLASGLSACEGLLEDREKAVARTVRHNPNPQHAYQLTMTLHDAPGPFLKVQGVMQYTIENNAQCGYKDPITKIVVSWRNENIPFTLEKISDIEYTSIIHTDLLLDDNYYGRETCHWQLAGTRTLLMATGADKETTFIANISTEDIISETDITQYFWKERYPYSNIDNYSESGSPYPDRFIPEARNDLFSITLTAKEVTP